MDVHDDNNQTVHGILLLACPFSQCPPKGAGAPVGMGGCPSACRRWTYGDDCIGQTKTNQCRGVDNAIQLIGGEGQEEEATMTTCNMMATMKTI